MRLVQLHMHTEKATVPVFVNPRYVVSLRPLGPNVTEIVLAGFDRFSIEGAADEIADKLEGEEV